LTARCAALLSSRLDNPERMAAHLRERGLTLIDGDPDAARPLQ
jgi:hypothetical protein